MFTLSIKPFRFSVTFLAGSVRDIKRLLGEQLFTQCMHAQDLCSDVIRVEDDSSYPGEHWCSFRSLGLARAIDDYANLEPGVAPPDHVLPYLIHLMASDSMNKPMNMDSNQ